MSKKKWIQARASVLRPFVLGDDGRFYQKRMVEEYAKFEAMSKSRKEAALGRWKRKREPEETDANAMQVHSKCISFAHAKEYEPSDYDSEDGSLGEDRGVGKGEEAAKPPQFELSGEGLAQEWCFYLTRRRGGAPRDSPLDVAVEMTELMRIGIKPKAIRAAILDKNRDRSEPLWEFRDRLKRTVLGKPGEPKPLSEDELRRQAARKQAEQQARLNAKLGIKPEGSAG